MSVVAAMQPRLDQDRTMPQRVASDGEAPSTGDVGWLDAAAANWRLALDDDEAGNFNNRVQAYDDLENSLVAMGKPRAKYRDPKWTSYWGTDHEKRFGALWQDVAEARRTNPRAFADIPKSQAEFDTWAYGRKGEHARDRAVSAQGGFGSQIVPSLAFGISTAGTAENLPQLLLGGGTKTASEFVIAQFYAGMLGTALQTPHTVRSRANMGEGYSAGELATDMLIGGAANTAFAGAIAYGPKVGAKIYDKVVPFDYRAAQALKGATPRHLMTPDVAAAWNVLTRHEEVADASPFERTYAGTDAHFAKLREVTEKMTAGDRLPIAPVPVARELGETVSGSIDAYMASARRQESGGNDGARSGTSSAAGRYGFIDGTWVAYYRKTFPNTGLSDAAIISRKGNGQAQDRVMRTFTEENAAWLQSAGQEATPGNLYVVHHMGTGGAGKIFAAAADVPLASILTREVMDANPHLKGMTAGDFRSWADRKMGGDGSVVPRPFVEAPRVRPEALDAVRPVVTAEGRAIDLAQFLPEQIEVDAALMQFKSGGDQFGVTERLQGVREWDPMAAGTVTVWESADGRRLIADGHQRLGLAKRMREANPDQPIIMNAFVLREADGFSARDARVLTALKNIGEGTGSAADAAKVFRDTGVDFEEAVARRLPPKSALVRDGKALARLSDDAFGSIINEVIPEPYGAAIGHLAPDPATHAGLVDLLHKLDPPNRRQAETIIKSALDAGFVRETQEELFGTRDTAIAIFAMKARVLDKALSELRKLKGAFSVAVRNADALDAAGNRIDVSASEAAAQGNARALALVEALALRKGNAVSDIINAAAERLARGESISAVNRDVIRQLSAIDLANVERAAANADGAGGPVDGSGRNGIADNEVGSLREEADLTPATRDELEAAGQGGFSLFDEPAHTSFDDPAGDGIAAVADSAWHDVRATVPQDTAPPSGNLLDLGEAVDPAIRERERQKLQLRAETPLGAGVKGGQATGVAQNDVLPEGLFGGKEVPTFNLGDGKGARSIDDIEAEVKADEAAIDAIRNCLL